MDKSIKQSTQQMYAMWSVGRKRFAVASCGIIRGRGDDDTRIAVSVCTGAPRSTAAHRDIPWCQRFILHASSLHSVSVCEKRLVRHDCLGARTDAVPCRANPGADWTYFSRCIYHYFMSLNITRIMRPDFARFGWCRFCPTSAHLAASVRGLAAQRTGVACR